MATFYDAYEKIIYQNWFEEGTNVTDPITAGWIAAPRKESTDEHDFYYDHWTPSLENISEPTYFYPVFDKKTRSYTVYFTDEGGLSPTGHIYATCEVQYGGKAVFPGDTNTIYKYINGEPSEYYDFAGWSSNIEQKITKSEIIVAQFNFDGFLEESWADIIENCKKGNITNYNLGARKRHTFTYSDKEITVEMEIVGINHDELEQPNSEYNNGATTAALTWITYVVLPILTNVNSAPKNWSGIPGEGHQSGGGWELSDLRAEFNGALLNALDDTGLLQANIKSVAKVSDHGRYHPNERVITYDKIWAPSNSELNYEASSMVVPNQGTPYRLYTDSFSRKKYMYDNKDNYTAVPYWTRSSHVISHQWYYVPTTGSPTSISAGNKQICYMCFGFCL